MTKQECQKELKELLARLQERPLLVKESRAIISRIDLLCGMLDAFEAEGK